MHNPKPGTQVVTYESEASVIYTGRPGQPGLHCPIQECIEEGRKKKKSHTWLGLNQKLLVYNNLNDLNDSPAFCFSVCKAVRF